jgi:hypothetical protein
VSLLANALAILASSSVVTTDPPSGALDRAADLGPAPVEIAPPEPDSALVDWYMSQPPVADENYWVDKDGYYRTIYRKFTFSVGFAAYADFNTQFQVNSKSTGAGANLDMENLLGLEDSRGVARFDGAYAFNRKNWLQFSYYDIRRTGDRTIANDIQVGDVVIPAGEVASKFDTAIFKLAYRYNFVTDQRTVIGASIGLHVMAIDTKIQSETNSVDESYKVNAPLPLLGLHGAYALGEKWKLSASAEFLQFDISSYRGLVTDTRLTLENDTFKNFGWGVGFNGFRVNGDFQGNGDLSAKLDYGYQGLMIYLRFML